MSSGFILALCSSLLAGGIALATACRAKPTVPHWSFAAGMAILAVESFFFGLGGDGLLPDTIAYWQSLAFCAMSLLPGVWLLFSVTYSRGNYRQFLNKWRLLLWAAFLLPVSLAACFRSQLVVVTVDSAGRWLLRVGTPGLALSLIFLLSAVLVVMNLEATFRATVGTMRWRIKFMVLGLGVLFAGRAYSSSQLLLFRSIHLPLQELNSGALLLACLLILRSLFRTGHFEVNVFPSQAVLHNSLTVFLAGVYLIIVGVLAKLVAFLGGDASFERKAFLVFASLVLLTVLLLSDRVRLYTKRFVSRHFQRPLYDYRTVWRTFAESTAKCVEQTDLCGKVVKLVSEIFQALSVSIWLVDEKKEKLLFGASTSLSRADAGNLTLSPDDAAEVIAALSRQPGPIDIDSSNELWAAALRRSHPFEFREGGNRACVPLIAAGELLGILVLGDRVAGVTFSIQDFDLLKSASDQAAASLLNIQLSHRLSQAKQLEAFQAMSAFFVHDLKNTASTLSLMLQNLPIHYQDPKFREDALRGVSKTVDHINDLISRLTVLRHDLQVKASDCDLNELVTDTLNAQDQARGIELRKELQALPKLRIDAGQIQKVITNLLLNAREALPDSGTIRVETSQRNGWAVLSVSDNGCGMTPEFINRSLFRPFSTTKKKGIGIGMFHCKMIVEAHHGRIEVQSESGKGTTFRVLLPLGTGAKSVTSTVSGF
jgi:putative PEP-CTERM system histidine kinase